MCDEGLNGTIPIPTKIIMHQIVSEVIKAFFVDDRLANNENTCAPGAAINWTKRMVSILNIKLTPSVSAA